MFRADIHDLIRKKLDPSSTYITDEDIQRAIMLVGGVPDLAARRLLLTMLDRATALDKNSSLSSSLSDSDLDPDPNRSYTHRSKVRFLIYNYDCGLLDVEPNISS